MEAIILAGGFGTRLKGILNNIPKPMAPINNKPFLEYLLDELVIAGFSRVILSVGHMSSVISNHFGNYYKTIEIVYSVEDEPLGTGGAVKLALNKARNDMIYVINGDTFFKVDFEKMVQIFRTNSGSIIMALKFMNDCSRYGTVEIDNENKVVEFREKNPDIKNGLINGGIYLIPKSIFNKFDISEKFSLEKDFFEKYFHDLNIEGFTSTGYFLDIGIPEDYRRAQNEF